MIPAQVTFHWPETVIEIVIIVALVIALRWVLRKLVRLTLTNSSKRSAHRIAWIGAKATKFISGSSAPTTEFLKIQEDAQSRQGARAKTLATVLNSVIDVVLVITTVFWLLRTVNVDITPALASAGIGGLAIGFGAQSLIKDVISGMFLILEDQLGVGDTVTIDGLTGTVLSMQLRITQLQDASGEIWYIRNGEIVKLGNITQGWSSVVVNIPLNIDEDPFKVINLLTAALEKTKADPELDKLLLDEPSVLGLTSFDSYIANYGVSLKCLGNQQWAVERAVRANALDALRQAGIETLATPVRSIGGDEQGK